MARLKSGMSTADVNTRNQLSVIKRVLVKKTFVDLECALACHDNNSFWKVFNRSVKTNTVNNSSNLEASDFVE